MTTQLSIVRAAVDVGSVTTPYLRAGRGSSTILLCAGTETDPRRAWLLTMLAPQFGVVAPVTSVTAATTDWLSGFMDGLGLLRANIVADEAFAPIALRFWRIEAERVERVLLLTRASTVRSRTGDQLLEPESPAYRRLGIPESHPCDDGFAAEIMSFLLGDTDAPPRTPATDPTNY